MRKWMIVLLSAAVITVAGGCDSGNSAEHGAEKTKMHEAGSADQKGADVDAIGAEETDTANAGAGADVGAGAVAGAGAGTAADDARGPMSGTEKMPEWYESMCPPIPADSVSERPEPEAAYRVPPEQLTQTVHTGHYKFNLPKDWTFKDGIIYAASSGEKAKPEPVGSLQIHDLDMTGHAGYPTLVPEDAKLQYCQIEGGFEGHNLRHYEYSLPDKQSPELLYQNHYHFFEYGPDNKLRVLDLLIGGMVPGEVAGWIATTFGRDREADKNMVQITLDSEPDLKSTRAEVTPEETSYTVRFAEPMDRASVEKALSSGGIEYGPGAASSDRGRAFGKPEFSFHWDNDKVLRLTVKNQGDFVGKTARYYEITAKGAVTLSGEVLRNPSDFQAVVTKPTQIWRVAADGSGMRAVSHFTKPYWLELLRDGQTVLLKRNIQYCECDIQPSFLYGLFDLSTGKEQDVPYTLLTTYRGPGRLVADPRGFFYSIPGDGASTPSFGDGERLIRVDGYVQTAAFSHDGKRILMLVGKSEDQVKDLDLWLYTWADGKLKRVATKVKGGIEANQVGSGYFPVGVTDDGRAFYFSLTNDENLSAFDDHYRYDWGTGKLGTWVLPEAVKGFAFFSNSADGVYRQYYQGLYKGDTLLDLLAPHGHWLGKSHLLAYIDRGGDGQNPADRLVARDADTGSIRIILDGLPPSAELLGSDSSGSRLYLSMLDP